MRPVNSGTVRGLFKWADVSSSSLFNTSPDVWRLSRAASALIKTRGKSMAGDLKGTKVTGKDLSQFHLRFVHVREFKGNGVSNISSTSSHMA